MASKAPPKGIFYKKHGAIKKKSKPPKGVLGDRNRKNVGNRSDHLNSKKFDPENVNDLEIVEISGRSSVSSNAGVNGWYHKQREWYNDRPYFRKFENDWTIVWNKTYKKWQVYAFGIQSIGDETPNAQSCQLNNDALTKMKNPLLPPDDSIGKWEIRNDDTNEFVIDGALKVRMLTQSEIQKITEQQEFHRGKKCPRGHNLHYYKTDQDRCGCDICHIEVFRGTILFGCQTCEWDICYSCLRNNLDEYLRLLPMIHSKSHLQIVNCVDWAPNYITLLRNGNPMFASGSEDQTIKLWQLSSSNNSTSNSNNASKKDSGKVSSVSFSLVRTFDTSPLAMVEALKFCPFQSSTPLLACVGNSTGDTSHTIRDDPLSTVATSYLYLINVLQLRMIRSVELPKADACYDLLWLDEFRILIAIESNDGDIDITSSGNLIYDIRTDEILKSSSQIYPNINSIWRMAVHYIPMNNNNTNITDGSPTSGETFQLKMKEKAAKTSDSDDENKASENEMKEQVIEYDATSQLTDASQLVTISSLLSSTLRELDINMNTTGGDMSSMNQVNEKKNKTKKNYASDSDNALKKGLVIAVIDKNHARRAVLVWLTVHPLKDRFEILRRETLYHPKSYAISSLQFSDDGEYLLIGGNDGTLHIWNIPNIDSNVLCNVNNFENEFLQFKKLEPRHVTSKKCHFGPISSLSIQDKMIITGSWDGNVIIWSLLKNMDDGVTGHSNLKYFDNESDDDENNNEQKNDGDDVAVSISGLSRNSNQDDDDKESGKLFSDSNVVIPIMRIEKPATKVNASNNASMHTSVLMCVSLPMSNKRSKNVSDASVNQLPPYLLFGARNSQVGVVSCVDELMKSHSKYSLESIKLSSSSTADGDEMSEAEKQKQYALVTLSASQLNKIETHHWDILKGWYTIWTEGSAILSAVSTMAKPILKLLKKDKIEYNKIVQTFTEPKTHNNNNNNNNNKNNKNNKTGGTKELSENEYFLKIKKETELIQNDIAGMNPFVVNDLKQESRDLNTIRKSAVEVQRALTDFVQRLAKESFIDGIYEGDPGIKGGERCVEKTILKHFEKLNCVVGSSDSVPRLDYSHLKDVSRAGLRLNSMQNMYYALHKIRNCKKWFNMDIKIVRIKNRFLQDKTPFGYRDILLNIIFEDVNTDFICELQLHHNKFQQLRSNGMGHANYQASRFLIDFVLLMAENEGKKSGSRPSRATRNSARREIMNSVQELIRM